MLSGCYDGRFEEPPFLWPIRFWWVGGTSPVLVPPTPNRITYRHDRGERSPGGLALAPQTVDRTQRADTHGKRTQPTVGNGGVNKLHAPTITPLSFMLPDPLSRMLPVMVDPGKQNGGSNTVLVPSGDRTKP